MSQRGKVAEFVAFIPLLAAVAGSFAVPSLCYYSLVFLAYHTFREISLFSKVMVKLLVRRRSFQIATCFTLLWFAIFVAIFQNEQIILAFDLAVISFLELLKDASLKIPTKRARMQNKFVLGLGFCIISLLMIFNRYETAGDVYINVRPDISTAKSNISYSDLPQVVDMYQECVDLGISLGLGHLFWSIYLLFYTDADQCQVFKVPVVPSYHDRAANGPSMGSGQSEIAVASSIHTASKDSLRVVDM